MNTQVLACSCDTVWANQVFAATLGGISFPIIGDHSKELAQRYGVLRTDGLANRGTFFIDQEGILRWSQVNEIEQQRNIEEILKAIQTVLGKRS